MFGNVVQSMALAVRDNYTEQDSNGSVVQVKATTRIREHQHRRGRRALALVAALWLNITLQPCLMAFTGEATHNCPHCPPSVHQPTAAAPGAHQSAHGAHHGPMQHAMSDVESVAHAPCAAGEAACPDADPFVYEGRTTKILPLDKFDDTPPAAPHNPWPLVLSGQPDALFSVPSNPVLPGKSPPHRVLHCTYLK